ncbi:P-type conjugative transfer protein TrbL [Bradyrhizobium sp. GM7.3]
MGYVSFFENFVQIVVLLFAWIVVLLAFFILAIQLFVTLVEFKLTTLAGFVLIPFGLFGKTAFAAERVLGNVISSGVKVLVLAVIVGIGSTFFSQFTAGFGGNQPTIENAMALVLGALTLLGLGIFGPGIANGIVSGGPQLGAGSAVGDRPRRRWRCCGWRRSRRRRGRSRRRRDCWRGTWRQRDCKWYDERVAGGEHVRRRGKCVRCG